MIGIIDTGICNVRSLQKAFEKINREVFVLNSKKDFMKCERIVLPGVGSWDYAVESLHLRDLWQAIIYHSKVEKKPILGICLGMQLLAETSEEGTKEGLCLIPGNVRKMVPINQEFRVPNVGWSYVKILPNKGCDSYLKKEKAPRFYFVHSYHFSCENKADLAMEIELDKSYTAAVIRDNIWGVQFHPEKSHNFGLEFLKIWVNS